MYKHFYGFTQDPFLVAPDPNFFYVSPKHEEALARIVYGIRDKRAVMMLSGEVGAGKTTLMAYILKRLPKSIQAAMITNSNLGAEPLLRMILAEFNVPATAGFQDKSTLIKDLQTHLLGLIAQNRRGLLVIDEAQNLPLDALEEIRMLNNLQVQSSCLLQIILVGQPELRARMRDPRYVQIAQRIAFNYHIEGLSKDETRAYIIHRLMRSGGRPNLFTDAAAEVVFQLSRGIPRMINLVCDSALIYGFSESLPTIEREIVAKAAKQLDLMGLVNASSIVDALPNTPSGGNGKGKAPIADAGGTEKNLAAFIGNLKQETQKLCEQSGPVTTSAGKLAILLEEALSEHRSGYDTLCAESTKLNLLKKLLDQGLKE
jgi:general secretion pathway protein A